MYVKITRAGDGEFRVGQIVELDEFILAVKAVLENGGEMPIAILWT